jgi:hypothetical protein
MHNYGGGIGSSPGREYQGYPYMNHVVNDVPSIDATTAARWNNLPRRPAFEKKETSPVVYIDIPSGSGLQSTVSQVIHYEKLDAVRAEELHGPAVSAFRRAIA